MPAPYRSRLLLPETLPFRDAAERRWWYNYRGAGGPQIPTGNVGRLVWAFDPDLATPSLIGPAGTVTGATLTAKSGSSPAFYTLGATDTIEFGDALDAVWTGEDGWTVHVAINIQTADLTGSRYIVNKYESDTASEFQLFLTSGKLRVDVVYGGDYTAAKQVVTSTNALAAGRHVLSVAFDPSATSAARVTLYDSGSVLASGSSGTEAGDVSNTVSQLRLGKRPTGSSSPASILSYAYGYLGAQDAEQVAAVADWVASVKGWQ